MTSHPLPTCLSLHPTSDPLYTIAVSLIVHAVTQTKLDEERHQVMLLKQNHEHLEEDLRGYKIRNREYEEGQYGLPQASSISCS